jgi:glycosyltransferase involved in cell wall biosynthesis
VTIPEPLRILHVVGGMNRGGVETWLMHVLRRTDPGRFRMDFLVHTDRPCPYDDEIRARGSQVLACPAPSRPWRYARNFLRLLRRHGPYHVVHSHVHHYSGFVLRLARAAGVPVRIAHSHNDTSHVERHAGVLRRLYLAMMAHWLARCATGGLAASGKAAADLFGPAAPGRLPWRVLYCGVDLGAFRETVDRGAVRAELGLPAGAFVLGHVGRFAEQKNHQFLVEVTGEVVRREPRAHLVMVGDGPLRPAVERAVAQAGLADRTRFAGSRPDVPRLLRALDVFVMPSRHEGLPLVGIEAQAAGLPLVLSEAVTPELDRVPGLVRRLSLAQPASVWADAVLAAAPATDQGEALAHMERGPFNIHTGVQDLEQYYAAEIRRA